MFLSSLPPHTIVSTQRERSSGSSTFCPSARAPSVASIKTRVMLFLVDYSYQRYLPEKKRRNEAFHRLPRRSQHSQSRLPFSQQTASEILLDENLRQMRYHDRFTFNVWNHQRTSLLSNQKTLLLQRTISLLCRQTVLNTVTVKITCTFSFKYFYNLNDNKNYSYDRILLVFD